MTENKEAIALMESHVAIVMGFISPFGVWATPTIEKKVNSKHPEMQVRKVLFHMADYGWVVFRYDIGVALPESPNVEVLSFQLTDDGRKLKALGSVHLYHRYIEDKMSSEQNSKRLNDLMVDSNLVNGKLTKRLFFVNLWIAGSTVVAGLYYLYMIQIQVKKDHPIFYQRYYPFAIPFFCTLLALILVIHISNRLYKKAKARQQPKEK